MALFPLPTAAEVVQESRLKTAQVNTKFPDEAALLNETTDRISKKADFVDTKILKHSSRNDWGADSKWSAEDKARRQRLATETTLRYSVASVVGSAGQLNSAYWERAKELRAEAKESLDSLLEDLDGARVADGGGGSASGNGSGAHRSGSVKIETSF